MVLGVSNSAGFCHWTIKELLTSFLLGAEELHGPSKYNKGKIGSAKIQAQILNLNILTDHDVYVLQNYNFFKKTLLIML